MKFFKTPYVMRKLYPDYIWNIEEEDNTVYLTFDDGPDPEVTPWVLETLEKHGAKATFFCVGRNVERHPSLMDEILKCGHGIGNHTYSHLNGFKSKSNEYNDDVQLAGNLINSNLFRPPYGKISKHQFQKIRKDFNVVMWDVLSYDFSKKIIAEHVLYKLIRVVRGGSIVVFHDSKKSLENLSFLLPGILQFFVNQGYILDKLEINILQKNKEYKV